MEGTEQVAIHNPEWDTAQPIVWLSDPEAINRWVAEIEKGSSAN